MFSFPVNCLPDNNVRPLFNPLDLSPSFPVDVFSWPTYSFLPAFSGLSISTLSSFIQFINKNLNFVLMITARVVHKGCAAAWPSSGKLDFKNALCKLPNILMAVLRKAGKLKFV
ncbi:hypothetical protein TNCT_169271 [Trichonephila clavata]|uniref:Uncharacterized protein n=1 Tax=Trichonephila clavata TaxID=2740835 RepID=A0A8X6F299_TRICU|nr:hypothetical protein TNCT_169271 [Trichonephila clavata]